ncbi:mechanosensitive ion channel family protein [Corynebacterium hansenii]|uniref:Mechanosensitive ion channel family protein n=1 Tax=Corynebacterium hansenii TaxID=394964 RepID=A0ABV7ZTH3_9CORY|nr:mechanosensitive ion channel family protein [Corynebacterium hansenii]WJY99625.1 putative MscS family protein YkuT [Corynebacterium hansenii]
MDFILYLLQRSWAWIATNGLAIASLLILIVLVPRIRRFVIAVATWNMADGAESTKGRRALIGAVVYIVEMIAYFVIGIALLNKFGVSLTAAAIPATVVSAAIGFGAQGVIGDLIGGVFIIAEKQYGIGDWVEFHSPSGTVQGDVVNMTLRATTIRTLNGEEVVVPNSQARMCVNYSSRWSRAVIEIPVPMTASGSIRDLEERTLEAARRAIAADGVREHVLSEVRIQSSTELVAPTTMGLPWTVTMRLIADCEPGDQWLIERAVRAEIIDTWWDDYGERAESNPLQSAEAITAQLGALPAQLGQSPVTRPDAPKTFSDTPDTVLGADRGAGPADAASRRGEGSLEVEQANAAKAAQESSGSLDDDDRRRSDLPSAGAAMDERRRDEETKVEPAAGEEAGSSTAVGADDSGSERMSKRERVRRVLSAGGRARPSTVVMIVALIVLGMLNLATVEPGEGEEGVAGWLAPSRFEGGGSGDDGAGKKTTGTETPTRDGGATTTTPATPAETPRPQDGERDTGTGDTGTGTGTGTGSDETGTGTGDSGTGTGTGTGDSGTGTGTGNAGQGARPDSADAGTGGAAANR